MTGVHPPQRIQFTCSLSYTFNMVRQCVVEVCFQVWSQRMTCIQTLSTCISNRSEGLQGRTLVTFITICVGYISTSLVCSLGLFSGLAPKGGLYSTLSTCISNRSEGLQGRTLVTFITIWVGTFGQQVYFVQIATVVSGYLFQNFLSSLAR